MKRGPIPFDVQAPSAPPDSTTQSSTCHQSQSSSTNAMNGAGTRNQDEASSPQLPTPAQTPSPSLAPSPLPDRFIDGIITSLDGTGLQNTGETTTYSSRRPSFNNDEAVMSDTSERVRPLPSPLKIKRTGDSRRSSVSEHDKMLKLSPKQIVELTSEPASLPIRAATPIMEEGETPEEGRNEMGLVAKENTRGIRGLETVVEGNGASLTDAEKMGISNSIGSKQDAEVLVIKPSSDVKLERDIPALTSPIKHGRPALSSRAVSTPPVIRRRQSARGPQSHVPPPLNLEHKDKTIGAAMKPSVAPDRHRDAVSPVIASMPLPPLSMPTFLSLELSADRPSPLYIYRPATDDFPYESSKIKYERLVNFLFLPPKLEGILGFGALACLDAWMHILTILPLRFVLAVFILFKWWGSVVVKECRDVARFVWNGTGRVWRRRRNTEAPTPLMTPAEENPPAVPNLSRGPSFSVRPETTATRENGTSGTYFSLPEPKEKRTRSSRYRHRRTKSTPSALLPSHKADILKGLLVIMSCAILMRFDPSRMYHGIRGQSAIKLYVIYNVLEVCDRLLSAVGQDVLECLFSRETLDRNSDGRSKVIRPFWMFVLALVYNVTHATALFYQVITLNVAVNSYSNALLTLLLSNQFVEIKGTVFKKFEKENLFQITCADIVERFQLWLMLLIIAMRNIVEVGGLTMGSSGSSSSSWTSLFAGAGNSTATPFTATSIIPRSFNVLFPTWIGQVLNPFVLVLGSEMLVDWLKHAYITKFNQTKPEVYDKFLDVLAKDYYSNAFTDPNLTKRLGLPVLPLACLFIRAAIQTYHMFIATHMPAPFPSIATSLTTESTSTSSPATTAALAHIDKIFRRALGRSSFGGGVDTDPSWYSWRSWTLDDGIAFFTMCIVFLVGYLFFLAFKLALGMGLLSIARNRYAGMKAREKVDTETGGKRIGGWGIVDVDEEKRRWIYNDDPEALARLRERDEKGRKAEEKERERGVSFGHVSRYAMVAKRIW